MELDAEGRIVWTPTPHQFGSHPISLEVSDGEDTTTLSWTLNVSNQTVNRAPNITSTPNLITNLERVYQYQLEGFDPDGDLLLWTLDKAPSGMVIDPNSGMLSWQPNATQLGEHTIAIRVTDATGYFVGQEFDLTVRGINTPPEIVSVPITTAAVGQEYRYQIASTDIENDGGRYSLGIAPDGMQIDPETGLITWTPTAQQSGSVEVEVLAIDDQNGVNRQTYTIEVGSDAINHPPVITSTAKYFAATGVPYRYQIEATDADNDALIYQPISVPNGMTLDANTGELRWDSPTFGTHQVVVGVNDGRLGAAQGFTLTVQNDLPPVFNTNEPPTVAIPNRLFSYDIQATDPNGSSLTYRLDDTSIALGMTVDELGRLRWTPTVENVGTHAITIEVMDELGTTATQTFNLEVSSDTISPVVQVLPSGVFIVDGDFEVPLGTPITFFTNATDNVGVEGVQLFVDEVPVTLTVNGTASYTPSELGTLTAKAVAVDAAGNLGESSIDIRVYDPNDLNPPIVELSPTLGDEPLTDFTDIIGTVTDDNLTNYVLSIAPASGGEFVEIASGNSQVTNAKLGEFDPTLLQNDTYVLRLTATDESGNSASTEQMVDVAGELKLGNFRLSFTDLEVPVAGIPINLTRTYDTLNASQSDDFGYGWRLEFRDTDLRTSVGRDELYEQTGIPSVGFEEGTRVYVTLPGGKRTGFTFKPVMDPEIVKALRMGAPLPQSMIFYNPAFETDDGEQVTLSAQKTQLLYNQETGQYYHPSGSPYNPANSFFGGSYTLTTKEGIEYVIDGTTGDLLTVTDTNGNTLTYSDEGIFSSTGKSVTFERNASGRIVAAIDPEGERIEYEYDENGDLVGVTDREENTTRFEYHEEREHYLEEIIDPLGRTGVRTEYDESGRLKRMLDVNGEAVELVYDPDNSTQTVLDVFGNPTTYVYDERGNVVTEIDSKGGINQYTYDEDNNLLSETDRDGIVTQYTYDSNGNITSTSDGDGKITRMSYNQYGQVLSIVSPTGLTVSYKYDSRGNLIESTDTDGLTTTYVYDNTGKLIRQVAPDGQTMEWGYDTFGNPTRMVDTQGNEVNATYDRNGRMQNASMDFSVDGETHTLSRNFTYDKEGRTLSGTNSQGNTQSQTYNELGKVASTTDILGNVTLYDYNDKGLLTRVTLPDYTPDNPNDNPQILKEYDAAGRLVKETSPLGLVIEYVYDELGRTSETILPDLTPDNPSDNPRIQTEYTPAGRIARQRDILGNWTSFDYDHLGRLIKETDVFGNHTTTTYNLGGQIASITDGRNRTTNLVYDEKSRLKEAVLFDQTKFSLTYDSLGRVASETNPLGQTTRYEYDDFGRVNVVIDPLNQRTEVEYDNRGNLTKVHNALGQITRYEYDEYGRQTAAVFANGDRVEMGYDNFNRQITAKDENGNITQYEYDNFNRTTAIELANNARTRYNYDNLGQLIKIEDALNRSTQFEYDDFGRMVATILPMGQRSDTVFDNLGFLGSYTDFNGDTIDYDYDNFGRLQQKTFSNPDIAAVGYTYDPVTSQMRTVSDGRGVTSYEYDNRDRLSQITNPDGKAIGYGYDVLNNVTSLTTESGTTSYTYDALNRLDWVKDGNEVLADYDYDAIGNLVQTTRADGTVETRSYDNRSRLTDIETLNSVGQEISSFSYTLDGVGNRTQVVEHGGRTVNYAYDSVNRLLQEKISPENQTIDYTYDLVGNRLSRNDSVLGLTTYDYDANDRLTQMLSAGVTTQFTYDNNGSMLSRSNGLETVTYDWINDGENRLVGVNSTDAGGNQSVNYVYDAQGNRVASIGDGVRTNYLVTPGGLSQVLAEYDSNGRVTTDYTYGLGLVRSVEGGSDSFYHTDGLGSVRMLTDTTGLVSDRNSYDAYGISLSNTKSGVQTSAIIAEKLEGKIYA